MKVNSVRPNIFDAVIGRLPPEAPPSILALLKPLHHESAVLNALEDSPPDPILSAEAMALRVDAQRTSVRELVTQSEPELAREISAWRAADNAARMPDEKFAAEVRTALRVALFVRQPHARHRS